MSPDDATFAATVFPLDHTLGLRKDHYSPGLARVAVREGLQARSFERAAEAVSDAVGGASRRTACAA